MQLEGLGGWDDDFLAAGEDVSVASDSISGGYLGVGSATLEFWRGRASRSITVTGRTHVTSYVDLGIDPLVGADGAVSGLIRLGRRTTLTGVVRGAYAPALTLAAFAPVEGLADSGVVANVDPTRAVAELRSRRLSGSAGMSHDWNLGHTTSLSYDLLDRRFLNSDSIVSPYDNDRSQSASVNHLWSFSRTAGLRAEYRYSDQLLHTVLSVGAGEIGLERPTESHSGEVGMRVQRMLTRTRALGLSAQIGATRVQTVSEFSGRPYDYVTPSGSGTVRLDLARTWGISGDYRRSVSVLDGVALNTFVTDAASVTIGGNLGSRMGLAMSGAISEGTTQSLDRGSFDGRIGTAQLQYELTACCSILSSYTYYEHRVRDLITVPTGFPPRFERNSIRVGMTVDLPLYGNSSTGTSRPRVRN